MNDVIAFASLIPSIAMDALPAAMLGLLAVGILLYAKLNFEERARLERLRAVVTEANLAREKIAARAADVQPLAEAAPAPRLAEHVSKCEDRARRITASLDDLIRSERIQSTSQLLAVRDESRRLALHLHGILANVAPGLTRERVPRGFTLIETLLVCALIGILTAIAIPLYSGVQAQARLSKARADAKVLAVAVSLYHMHHSALPPTLEAVTELTVNDFGQALGPHVAKIPDPPGGWSPYAYAPDTTTGLFTITSSGDGTALVVP